MVAGGALLMAKAIGTWDRAPDAPGYLAVEQFQSRSKCRGDGGDGILTFSFEGTGYYKSSS
eukprot:4578084-Ditylum_brightwellii.AAC.1